MQVYRGMDIGTAKPDAAARRRYDYRMIDLVDPDEEFTVGAFQRRGRAEIAAVSNEGKPVVLVGGSGLHFRALVDPISPRPRDPELAAEIAATPAATLTRELLAADPRAGDVLDLANPRRVQRAVEVLRLTGETPSARAASEEARALREYRPVLPFVGFGLDPGEGLRPRVAARLAAMMAAGFLEEVRGLVGRMGRTASQALGYRELLGVVDGSRELRSAVREIESASVALARRQRTFFRRDPRIRWLTWQDDPDRLADAILLTLEKERAWTS